MEPTTYSMGSTKFNHKKVKKGSNQPMNLSVSSSTGQFGLIFLSKTTKKYIHKLSRKNKKDTGKKLYESKHNLKNKTCIYYCHLNHYFLLKRTF